MVERKESEWIMTIMEIKMEDILEVLLPDGWHVVEGLEDCNNYLRAKETIYNRGSLGVDITHVELRFPITKLIAVRGIDKNV